MANTKIGMVFLKDQVKCGVVNKAGFEGMILEKGALYMDFYFHGEKVSYEVFTMCSKKHKSIKETFNKYIKTDGFGDGTYTVAPALMKLDFVRDGAMLRLKGGPRLAA